MESLFLAKSNGELYQTHVDNVVKNIDIIIDSLALKVQYKKLISALSKASAICHDLGKLTKENQEILTNNSGVLRHSAISAAMTRGLFTKLRNTQFYEIQDIIIYAVLWHHQLSEEEKTTM